MGEKRERARRCVPALFIFIEKGTLLAFNATTSLKWSGKVAKRAGESEDLPGERGLIFVVEN